MANIFTGGKNKTRNMLLFVAAVIVAAGAGAATVGLLVNIFEKKQEAKNPFYRVVELTDETEDPAVWGKNFPFQYDRYLKTVDMKRPSSAAAKRSPTPLQTPIRAPLLQKANWKKTRALK
jgi:nitrite reductase (cytochrome c-552)